MIGPVARPIATASRSSDSQNAVQVPAAVPSELLVGEVQPERGITDVVIMSEEVRQREHDGLRPGPLEGLQEALGPLLRRSEPGWSSRTRPGSCRHRLHGRGDYSHRDSRPDRTRGPRESLHEPPLCRRSARRNPRTSPRSLARSVHRTLRRSSARMIADIVQTAHVVVGPGARVRRRAGVVRLAVRVPAGARLPVVRLRGAGDRRGDAAARSCPILLFIAGFTLVFTLLGAFASTFVPIFKGETGQRIAGPVVVVIGVLMIAYALRRGSLVLYAERRPFLRGCGPARWARCRSAWRSRAGWTPCIGPALAGILAIAATQSTLAASSCWSRTRSGSVCRSCSSGSGSSGSSARSGGCGATTRWIAGVSGGLLIVVGVLLMTGTFTRLFAPARAVRSGL